MRRLPRLGRMEADILRYIADHYPVTVRGVAEHFAKEKGYARTTVLTVMERLRQKGYLTRKRVGSAYQYSPIRPKENLLRALVQDFIQSVLGGSLSPFMAYLAHNAELSEEEFRELRRLVRELDVKRREG